VVHGNRAGRQSGTGTSRPSPTLSAARQRREGRTRRWTPPNSDNRVVHRENRTLTDWRGRKRSFGEQEARGFWRSREPGIAAVRPCFAACFQCTVRRGGVASIPHQRFASAGDNRRAGPTPGRSAAGRVIERSCVVPGRPARLRQRDWQPQGVNMCWPSQSGQARQNGKSGNPGWVFG
jgi:hypothetical protein